MKIVYSPHLEHRLDFRKVPREMPERIYRNARERFFDAVTGRLIAVMPAFYKGAVRDMVIAYEERKGEVEILTIHPLKWGQKRRRILSGRWISHEKKA